jgi:serine/threonine protein kinase/Tfp pilus assembly protein PilF
MEDNPTPDKGAIQAGQERIGPYRLLEVLGEGGMGVVYLAQQEQPIRRRVALKLIKLGMDTKEVIARFETERQALAMMNHPNIASVLDAGATERGMPYFVMEHVAGIPIDDYCDRYRLSIPERLELMVKVCQAVQHAHQKGIIHRDLKPSNVLVCMQDGQPTPKVIDFGIAKATNQRLTERTLCTLQGSLIGTPDYMSPEQADLTGLDVDTRTDIYSLGAMLYKLLVGALPFDRPSQGLAGYEMLQLILHVEPPKLITRLHKMGEMALRAAERRRTDIKSLEKQLRGDLDWIAKRAMEKDPGRRYQSASELKADICRHLNNEAIVARPPSGVYQFRKMILRHKVGSAFVAVLLVLLVAFAATMGVMTARISAEKDRAEKEAAKAQAINNFLLETLGAANPIEGRGRDVTVLEALRTATEKISNAFANQPQVEGEVRQTIGVTYLRLGQYKEAEALMRSALRMLRDTLGNEHKELASPLTSLAVLRQELGDHSEAESLYRQALAIARKSLGDENQDTVAIQSNLALLLQDKGDLAGAEPLMRRALEVDRRQLGNDSLNVAFDLNNLGHLLFEKGDCAASEPLLREALPIIRKFQHPWLAISLGNLGELLYAKGDYSAAEQIMAEGLAIGLDRLGDKNQDVAVLRSKYGGCLLKQKRFDKAEEELLAALPILRSTLGDRDKRTQKTLRFLAELYEARGRLGEAAKYRAFLLPPK